MKKIFVLIVSFIISSFLLELYYFRRKTANCSDNKSTSLTSGGKVRVSILANIGGNYTIFEVK